MDILLFLFIQFHISITSSLNIHHQFKETSNPNSFSLLKSTVANIDTIEKSKYAQDPLKLMSKNINALINILLIYYYSIY